MFLLVKLINNSNDYRLFKSAQRVYDAGKIKKKAGNKLEAYVLFLRAGEIFTTIQRLPGKAEFVHTPVSLSIRIGIMFHFCRKGRNIFYYSR